MLFQVLADALRQSCEIQAFNRQGVRVVELRERGTDKVLIATGEGRCLEEALALAQENLIRRRTGADNARTTSFIGGLPNPTSPLDAWIMTHGHRLFWSYRENGFRCAAFNGSILGPVTDPQLTFLATCDQIGHMIKSPPPV